MVSSFLKYLEYEKRSSKHTLTSYGSDLKQLQQFLQDLGDNVSVSQASHQNIRSWLIHLLEKGLSPRTVNRKIATLRSYYKYAMRHGTLEKDPSARVKVLKTSRNLPVFIKEKDMIDGLDHMVYEDGFNGIRDQLVMEFLYATGARLSELIHLKEIDINFPKHQVKVLGKRNKERVVPVPKSLLPLIKKYSDLKRETFKDNYSPYLIVNNKGDQSYPMFIYRIVNKALRAMVSLEKQSPHILRHTFATHLLNKGAELNAVKELLGHASLAATQIYTHNSIDRLKQVFDQSHPKA